VDSQSQERTLGCVAQEIACGDLGKQEGEEGKSSRKDKQWDQRVESERVKSQETSAGPGSICEAIVK